MTKKPSGKVEFNPEECKGCGLCTESCPLKALKLSPARNGHGVHPVERLGEACSECGVCRYFCPEPGAIKVHRPDTDDDEGCAPAA